MSNKLSYLFSLVLILALTGLAQAEILLNPDFEAGLDSWATWGGGSGSGVGSGSGAGSGVAWAGGPGGASWEA